MSNWNELNSSRRGPGLRLGNRVFIIAMSGAGLLGALPGCDDPYAGDAKAAKPAEVVPKEKPRATTAYGKAMEAATDLRDKKVPEYNKKLEDLADPFAK